jgi:hypothetical protein
MRKFLGALCLISALVFSLAVQAAAPPANFAGTWTLDKSKSQGLSQRVQNVDISWNITQTDKTISIEEKVTGGAGTGGNMGGTGAPPSGAPPAGGAPAGAPPAGGQGGGQGGGRGMGGGMGMGGPRVFNLDGSETNGEMGQAKFVRKATLSSDGKTLELATKTTFSREGEEITTTQNDKLSLSADGKVLTVARHSEGGPRGPQDSTWVLNKQ